MGSFILHSFTLLFENGYDRIKKRYLWKYYRLKGDLKMDDLKYSAFFEEIELAESSDGLELELNPCGKSYSVKGRGTASGNIVIGAYQGLPITKICTSAFASSETVRSVSIGSSVEVIESSAFYHCESLREVLFAKGSQLKIIEDNAFSWCKLYAIAIPASLESIGKNAFSYSSVGNVHIADISSWCHVKLIDYYSTPFDNSTPYFNGAPITEITLPEGITQIGWMQFAGWCGLRSISIPKSVESIAARAFMKSKELESVTISSGTRTIGDSAFECCSSLHEVKLPDTLELIGELAFSQCYSIENMDLPGSVHTIKKKAFNSCTGIKKLTLNEGLQTLGDFAFLSMWSIEKISLPNSIREIGDDAFSGCKKLEFNSYNGAKFLGNSENKYLFLYKVDDEQSVCRIPSSTRLIAQNADNGQLTAWEVDGDNCFYSARDGILYTADGTTLLAYPISKNDKNLALPEGVTSIATGGLAWSDLESISLPESLRSIAPRAFAECRRLTSIKLPESLSEIPFYAFSCCSSLKFIRIPEGVKRLHTFTFEYCTSLESMILPKSIEQIDAHICPVNTLRRIFYMGNEEGKRSIQIAPKFSGLESACWYYYRESAPKKSSKLYYWHFDEHGAPTLW